MRAPVGVIDTNVLISGLLTNDETAPTAVILDGMLAGSFRFLLSPELIAEYRSVALRPKITKLHGLSDKQIDTLLTDIVANGIVREPAPSALKAPDPKDSHLWSLALSHAGSAVVTGDQLLLGNPPDRISVITPRAFVDLLRHK